MPKPNPTPRTKSRSVYCLVGDSSDSPSSLRSPHKNNLSLASEHGLDALSPTHQESSLDETAITDVVLHKEKGAGETALPDHRGVQSRCSGTTTLRHPAAAQLKHTTATVRETTQHAYVSTRVRRKIETGTRARAPPKLTPKISLRHKSLMGNANTAGLERSTGTCRKAPLA